MNLFIPHRQSIAYHAPTSDLTSPYRYDSVHIKPLYKNYNKALSLLQLKNGKFQQKFTYFHIFNISTFDQCPVDETENLLYNGDMKLERDFEIKKEAWYDYIEKSFIEQVEKSTGRKIKPQNIKKGFKYVVSMNGLKTSVTVKDYKRGEIYAIEAVSGKDKAVTSYKTTDNEKGIHVVMEYDVNDFDKKKVNMGKLKRSYNEFFYLSRMSRELYKILDGADKINSEMIQEDITAAFGVATPAQKVAQRVLNKGKLPEKEGEIVALDDTQNQDIIKTYNLMKPLVESEEEIIQRIAEEFSLTKEEIRNIISENNG